MSYFALQNIYSKNHQNVWRLVRYEPNIIWMPGADFVRQQFKRQFNVFICEIMWTLQADYSILREIIHEKELRIKQNFRESQYYFYVNVLSMKIHSFINPWFSRIPFTNKNSFHDFWSVAVNIPVQSAHTIVSVFITLINTTKRIKSIGLMLNVRIRKTR